MPTDWILFEEFCLYTTPFILNVYIKTFRFLRCWPYLNSQRWHASLWNPWWVLENEMPQIKTNLTNLLGCFSGRCLHFNGRLCSPRAIKTFQHQYQHQLQQQLQYKLKCQLFNQFTVELHFKPVANSSW